MAYSFASTAAFNSLICQTAFSRRAFTSVRNSLRASFTASRAAKSLSVSACLSCAWKLSKAALACSNSVVRASVSPDLTCPIISPSSARLVVRAEISSEARDGSLPRKKSTVDLIFFLSSSSLTPYPFSAASPLSASLTSFSTSSLSTSLSTASCWGP